MLCFSEFRCSLILLLDTEGFPGGSVVKNLPAMQETWVWSLGWEDPLEEDMATHSSILAWRIPTDWGAWWVTFLRGGKELNMTEVT